MNELKGIISCFNLMALNEVARRMFVMIDMLLSSPKAPVTIERRLKISQATVYRLRDQINTALWDYEVVTKNGLWHLVERKSE